MQTDSLKRLIALRDALNVAIDAIRTTCKHDFAMVVVPLPSGLGMTTIRECKWCGQPANEGE